MPRLLSPEEFEAEFGGGFTAPPTERAGMGTRLGAGIDSIQGSLYGVGEAFGLDLGNARRENQYEAEQNYRRYYRDTGAPQSFRDIQGVGDAATWLGGLAVDSAPYLAGIAAGGLVGGPVGALAVGSTLGTADVLQNQREEAGYTNLGTALPLGAAYGAVDALTGVGGMVARRSLGTGLRTLDAAGTRYLDDMAGLTGGVVRAGAAGAKQFLVEGAGETFQEGMNQLGRMSVNPDQTFFNPEATDRYLESFVAGGALGGVAGATLGGWRRSDGYAPPSPTPVDTGAPVNLLDRAAPQQSVVESVNTQDYINQTLGIQRTPAPKDYAKIFGQAAGQPSGVWEADPVTGIERELDVQELIARRNGIVPAAPAAAADAQATQTAAPAAPKVFSDEEQALIDRGVKPNGKAVGLYQEMVTSGIDMESDLLVPVWTALSENKYKQAKSNLAEALIKSRSEANGQNVVAPTGAPATQTAAPGTQTVAAPATANTAAASPFTALPDGRVVLNRPATGAGQPSPVTPNPTNGTQTPQAQQAAPQGQAAAPVQPAAPAGQPVAGAPAQPVEAAGVSEPVSDKAPTDILIQRAKKRVVQVAPAAAPAAYVAPEPVAETQPVDEGDGYADDAEAWDDFRPDGAPEFNLLPQPLQQAWQLARKQGQMTGKLADEITNEYAADDNASRDETTQLLTEVFGERDAGILMDVMVNKMDEAEVANKYGVSRATVSNLASPTNKEAASRRGKKIAAAVKRNGWEPDYIQQALSSFSSPESVQQMDTTDMELDSNEGVGANDLTDADGVDRSDAAASDPTLADAGIGVTKGGSQGNWKDSGGRRLKVMGAETKKKVQALQEERAKLENDDTEQAAARVEAIDAEISQLEAEFVTPSEVAAARTQSAYEALSKAEKLAEQLRSAVEDGRSVVATTQGKVTIAEVEARIQQELDKYNNLLKEAEAVLTRGKAREKQGAEQPAEAPKAETKPAKKPKAAKAKKPTIASGEDLWNSITAVQDDLKSYEELDATQRGALDEIFQKYGAKAMTSSYGLETLVREARKEPDAKFGKDARATNPYTSKELLAELKDFMRADIPQRKLLVVDSVADLLKNPDPRVREVAAALALEGAYGVAADGRAFLVANRIEKGSGRAKFMHEVGTHLGLERLLPTPVYNRLVNQIKAWEKSDADTDEVTLAARAMQRVMNAGTDKADQDAELLAYFIEEAVQGGIDPTADAKASGPLREWFRTLWAAFKVAVRKLGFKPETLDAQDVVNLAFGAARLEIAGTWHGTAASFRKFNHKFMGTGEGAQAFGWGSYLAQRTGIAKGYWEADVKRKSPKNSEARVLQEIKKAEQELADAALIDSPSARESVQRRWKRELESLQKDLQDARSPRPDGSLMRVDTSVDERDMLDWDRPLSEQESVITKLAMYLPTELREAVEEEANADLGEMSGEDFYKALQFLEDRDGRVSEMFDVDYYNKNLTNAGPKKVVSTYLDQQIGIQGIRFLDAKSRGNDRTVTFDGKTYDWDSLSSLARKNRDDAELEMKYSILRNVAYDGLVQTKRELKRRVDDQIEMFFNIDKESSERYKLPFDAEKARKDAEVQAADYYHGKQLAWLEANESKITVGRATKTRNLVIFNDKNIFRVGGQAAADRQRMKFGKEAPRPANRSEVEKTINKLPPQLRGNVRTVWQTLREYGSRGLDKAVFTADLLDRAVKAGIKSASQYQALMAERGSKTREHELRVEDIADMYQEIPQQEQGTSGNSANAFIYDSTREGKWGYQPEWLGKVGVDQALEARWEQLSPQSKKWIDAVFKFEHDMSERKRKTVTDSAASTYDAMIRAAEESINKGNLDDAELAAAKKDLAKAKREKTNELKRFERLFSERANLPYAPLRRFGPWAVVAKSDEYRAAEAEGNATKLRELEKQSAHYYVNFAESLFEANTMKDELAKEFGQGGVQSFEREDFGNIYGSEGMLASLSKLRNIIDAESADTKQDRTAIRRMQSMVTEMYLQALADSSARKSEMRRRGVAGDIDMLRSFSTQGRADAVFLSAVEYNDRIQETIQNMRREARGAGDRTRTSGLFNEINKRYQQSLVYDPSPITQKITRLTSLWFLASSPGYYVQNLTQPYMVSVPVMAGRHGWAEAAAAQYKAYTELGQVVRSGTATTGYDFSKVPADVKNAVDFLVKRGLVDIGLDTELGEFQVTADNKVTATWNKVDKFLRTSTQKLEAINRLSTAIAAYRMELARAKKDGVANPEQAAMDYAARVINDTHGDYTAFNAPRIFNTNFGKIALQFRKFQLIQLTLLGKLFREAAFNPKERRAALAAMGFILGHTALMAGAMGLPGYAAIAWALGGLLGDDDEPFDLTQKLRSAIGDEDIANLLMKGAPTLAGADMSGKIGMGNALSILPFTDVNLLERRSTAEALGTLVGGASFGLFQRMADGISLINNGDYYKGIEMLVPKGITDLMKAARIAEDGVTRRNGDVLLPSSEVSAVESVMQALGVPVVEQTVRSDKQGYAYQTSRGFDNASSKIKNDFAKASRERDSTAMADARKRWEQLQKNRKEAGMKPEPMSTLLKAPQRQAERERNTVGGVQFNRNNQGLVESL